MRLFDELLSLKRSDKEISDFHIIEGGCIYFRKMGEIFLSQKIANRRDILEFLEEVGPEKYVEKAEKAEVYDCDFSFILGENRCRANVFLTCRGISIAIRMLNSKIKSMKELGIPREIEEVAKLNHGMVIVSGPTGSGKSTTLASIIEYINKNYKKHIITIEDPIEYIFENNKSLINQREVGVGCESFSSALKYSLRQDPDIIVVGEIRDEESLKIALRASETGHLCISTLHTLGAMDTIERLLNMMDVRNKEDLRYVLSNTVRCIISQQLVNLKLEKARLPIFEVIFFDKSVSTMVREGRLNQISNYIISSGIKNMVSMDEKLIDLYIGKKICYDDLIFYSIDKNYIRSHLGKYSLIHTKNELGGVR